MNLSIVGWSIDSGDWFLNDADTINKNILDEIVDGSVILFHDIYKHTPEVVNKLLDAIKKQGYVSTTISELINHNNKNYIYKKEE